MTPSTPGVSPWSMCTADVGARYRHILRAAVEPKRCLMWFLEAALSEESRHILLMHKFL